MLGLIIMFSTTSLTPVRSTKHQSACKEQDDLIKKTCLHIIRAISETFQNKIRTPNYFFFSSPAERPGWPELGGGWLLPAVLRHLVHAGPGAGAGARLALHLCPPGHQGGDRHRPHGRSGA